MEQYVVISKVKKYIKETAGMSTSSSFIEKLNGDISQIIKGAADTAKSNGRKTVMGRDFNMFVDQPSIEQVLVVASKVKKLIKDECGLSTSTQVMEQLTIRVENICKQSIESAQSNKRKTVMDKDFESGDTL
jgi:histone H3/H4